MVDSHTAICGDRVSVAVATSCCRRSTCTMDVHSDRGQHRQPTAVDYRSLSPVVRLLG